MNEFVIEPSGIQYLDIQPINLKVKINISDQDEQTFCPPNNSINLRSLYKPVNYYINSSPIKLDNTDYKSLADWMNNNCD